MRFLISISSGTDALLLPCPLYTDSEYQRLVAVLDDLIDVVGEDENHPLASLMEVIGVLIEKYEDEQEV